MLGTILNAGGIVLGSLLGLWRPKMLTPARESFFKMGLVVFTASYGLRLVWLSLNGPFWHILKQLLITVVALTLGRLTGRLLQLQKISNRLGQAARIRIEEASKTGRSRPGDGFKICAGLFCAAPLGILGAVQDGLAGYFYPLAVKAVMDGLAAIGFAALFGGETLLAAVPVLAAQGTLTLACRHFAQPFLLAHNLVDATNAAGGFQVCSVALVMLGVKRIEMADYLPSLLWAPLLAWMWGWA